MNIKTISDSTRLSIYDNLQLIIENRFERRDIKELIFSFRSLLTDELNLREVADIIAHPDEKSKGPTHIHVNYVYAVHEQITQSALQKTPIDFKVFQQESFQAILHGIKLYADTEILSKTDFTVNSATEFLKREYRKNTDENSYRLKDLTKFGKAAKLLKFLLNTEFPYRLPITDQIIFDDLIMCIRQFILHFDLGNKFRISDIIDKKEDILLCILTMFHDIKYKLYDNKIGSTFISSNDFQRFKEGLPGSMYRLSIYACIPNDSFEKGIIFPLFRTNLIASKYICVPNLIGAHLNFIPFDARRNSSGNLMLE